jgi:glucose/arabinose dehydrogenase
VQPVSYLKIPSTGRTGELRFPLGGKRTLFRDRTGLASPGRRAFSQLFELFQLRISKRDLIIALREKKISQGICMHRLYCFAALFGMLTAAPVLAQIAPPRPTPEQLEAAIKEDQLGDEKCGTPRNAADEYRPTPSFPGQTRAPRVSGKQPYKVEVVASGLAHPFALAFLPGGRMLVTIRSGGMRMVSGDGVVSEPLGGVPVITNPPRLGGMQDVILDQNFAKNRTLYFSYAVTAEGGNGTLGRILSAKLAKDAKSIDEVKMLREGPMLPRRIVQARDGTLFILSAEVASGGPNPQSLQSLLGKVLRINSDGTIPKDNPFLQQADADPALYAIGFRDSQGAALHPQTGELWTVENEPRGGDELNVVRAGKNYGFPIISYGRENNGNLINGGKTVQDGMEQPLYYWTPSVALSGMIFYTGNKLPGWKNNIFAGGLSGLQLVRLEIEGERVLAEEKLLRDRCRRMRDVRQGPDGLIYVITDDDNGEILRIGPDKK